MANIVQQFYDETSGFRLNSPDWIVRLNNLDPIDRKQFIVKIFHYGDAFTEKFLLSFPDWWKDYSLKDWIDFTNEQEHEFDILAAITFLYRFVEVDIMECFYRTALADRSIKRKVLKHIGGYPGICLKFGAEIYEGTQVAFPKVKQRLIKEGALAANYNREYISLTARELTRMLNWHNSVIECAKCQISNFRNNLLRN